GEHRVPVVNGQDGEDVVAGRGVVLANQILHRQPVRTCPAAVVLDFDLAGAVLARGLDPLLDAAQCGRGGGCAGVASCRICMRGRDGWRRDGRGGGRRGGWLAAGREQRCARYGESTRDRKAEKSTPTEAWLIARRSGHHVCCSSRARNSAL